GAGAGVPIVGFGNLLAKGVKAGVDGYGILGILTGGLKIAAPGIMGAVLMSFVASLVFNSKAK
ncbi:MAG: SpoVA/SpoVAEb family sporulation membrane protein, partial [Defluviitaleaceae bacterium]|nr:SpoVA/SpoVAEb family sporulation membrane protein [Defluviitaleaceae bacterium]